MARHTYPKRRDDDCSFPVRLLIKVPDRGFGGLFERTAEWLRERNIKSAQHPAPSNAWHASAWYFRSLEQAAAFLAAFPMLELADGVGDDAIAQSAPPISSGPFQRG